MNKLREFADWHDLADHVDEDTLVKWVNHYHRMILARDESGKKYRVKSQLLAQVAKKYLDPDELRRIDEEASRD